jgi:hypothetical protein
MLSILRKGLQAPVQLEQRLRAAFRDRAAVGSRRSAPQPLRNWVAAVAATLLIVFGALAWRAHLAALRQEPINVKVKDLAAPSEAPKTGSSTGVANNTIQSQHDSTAPERQVRNRKLAKSLQARKDDDVPRKQATVEPMEPANTLATVSETKEVTTDFVALGYGSTLDLQDGGQLVRVEFPRSALARFGLPMNMDRGEARVKADVLLGADGLARAIRFVK